MVDPSVVEGKSLEWTRRSPSRITDTLEAFYQTRTEKLSKSGFTESTITYEGFHSNLVLWDMSRNLTIMMKYTNSMRQANFAGKVDVRWFKATQKHSRSMTKVLQVLAGYSISKTCPTSGDDHIIIRPIGQRHVRDFTIRRRRYYRKHR